MEEYGYIENGYLRSKFLEPISEIVKDESGSPTTRIITIQQQIEILGERWKPVDAIDESKRICEDGYIIRLIPFDAGDHISYEYKKIFDTQKYSKEINNLKQQLSDSDYKVSKCYEASLLGEQMPYDVQVLHTERQAARDRINELESIINQNI